jgi:hypothetical protein
VGKSNTTDVKLAGPAARAGTGIRSAVNWRGKGEGRAGQRREEEREGGRRAEGSGKPEQRGDLKERREGSVPVGLSDPV